MSATIECAVSSTRGEQRPQCLSEYALLGAVAGASDCGLRGGASPKEAHDKDDARRGQADVLLKVSLGSLLVGAAVYMIVSGVSLQEFAPDDAARFDCSGDAGSRRRLWSATQREWCCRHESVGCQRRTETSSKAPFDCMAGFSNWAEQWSAGQKSWCCDRYGRGCVRTTTPVPFNCEAGLANWAIDWQLEKKAWCCEHER
eukprot:CAMPEP_0198523770 /NCGR_PEP_ID=MMETSP1462-20131121/22343_1 /TAXON_ID=1333877 /ORGANISM="Brandtodinium nutriculum, Strain RCC3387" /LENGTH=200 /DNA_ID=CAMNT_0044253479 /DNA_START=51 /DNA_END=649 /DNA_ORIENTATION=+